MATKNPDGSIGLTPEEGAKFYGHANEALMADIAAAAKTHGVHAISVCAITSDVGVLTFSTGADLAWREIARALAVKMGVDLSEMLKVGDLKIHGRGKVRRAPGSRQ
jgi:hypothetical protein